MRTKLTIFTICILLSTMVLAQDRNPMYYGFDATLSGFGNTSFRRNIPLRNCYDGYSSVNIYTFGRRYQVGGKFAIFSKNEKVGFETGLRYALHFKKIEAADKNGFTEEYLYLQNTTNTNSVDYYRITKVIQNTGYLSVPLELVLLPMSKNKFCRIYFKLGVELNVRIHENVHVKAFDSQFKDAVKSIGKDFKKSDVYYTTWYAGIGMQFGKPGEQKFSLQFLFPYLTNEKSSGIINTNDIIGFTFEYKLPVKR